jgi:cyanophycin synthetase
MLVGLPCTNPRIALKTLTWVVGVIRHAANGSAPTTPEAVERLLDELRPAGEPGTNTFHLADAAYRIGMPVHRPLSGTSMRRTVMIGLGCRARLFESTITERTPAFGVQTAKDKASTARILRQAGLPGAIHEFASTAQEAIDAASRLGYPVVVKPADQDRGIGVAADLQTDTEVAKAFERAREHSEAVLVERHCKGFTHRLTVVGGRLLKTVRRIAGGVHGDGVHDIASLIEIAQTDGQRQRRRLRTGQASLSLDAEARDLLAQTGLRLDSVPPAGTYVRLRRRDNVSAGGSNVNVALEAVHPDNRDLAVRAAALLRLDIAGIDLIIDDIGKSWLTREALICEINAQPQMGVSGTPDVYGELLRDMLGEESRIPVDLAITFAPEASSDQAIARVHERSGAHTVAHAGGLFVEGARISRPFSGGFEAATAALILPQTLSLLIVMSSAELMRKGLPVDKVDRIGWIGEPGADASSRERMRQAMALVGPCSLSQELW